MSLRTQPPTRQRTTHKTKQARQLRKAMTDAEVRLWTRLRQSQLGVRFRRQQPIGRFIVDFYCAKAKLIIEVDGGQHGDAMQVHDRQRDQWLRSEGYRVVRFWNNDVLSNTDGIVTDLMVELAAAGIQTGTDPSPNPLPQREGTNDGADR